MPEDYSSKAAGLLFGEPPSKAPPKGKEKPPNYSRSAASVLFGGSPTTAETKPEPPQEGNVLTRSVLTIGGGRSFSQRYGNNEFMKKVDSLVPDDLKRSQGGDYAARFLEETYKAGPEALDFITSPAGLGLMAAHMIPQARIGAVLADYGLAAYAGTQALTAAKDFMHDRSPENLAHLAVSLAGAYGAAKAGKGMAGGKAGEFKQASIRDSGSLIGDLSAEESLPEKVDMMDKAADRVPGMFWKKQLAKMYKSPVTRDVASMINVPKNDLLQAGADLVHRRMADIAVNKYEVNRMIHTVEHAVPENELKIYNQSPDGTLSPANGIAAVIQGTADESLLSPEGKQAVKLIRERGKARDSMLAEFYGENFSSIDADKYVAQIWDFGDSSTGRAARTVMRDRFVANPRTIENYQEGIAMGLKPKFNNILEVLKVREDHAITAIANQRMANTLKEMGALVTKEDKEQFNLPWNPQTDSPALYHATYSGTEKIKSTIHSGPNKGQPLVRVTDYMRYSPVYAHPDIEMAVKAIFAKPFESPGFAALDQVRAFGKKQALSFSMFHANALSEQSHGIYLTREGPLKAAAQTWFVPKALGGQGEYGTGLKTGLWEVMGKKIEMEDAPPVLRASPETVKPWLRAGMNLSSEDAEAGVVKSWRKMGLDSDKPWVKAATAPIRALGHLEHIQDRALWDYYHQGQMLNAAETIFTGEIGKLGPEATPEQVHSLRRAISDHVNNTYGALNWDQLLIHPKMRQGMNWALLAPGWTLSNMRAVTQAFEGETQARLAGRYLAGAGISWFATTQLFNYALTGWYGNPDKTGKTQAHFSWDNPGIPASVFGVKTPVSSNIINVAAGRFPNGQERYIRLGKGLMEPFGWMTDPVGEFKGKLSLPFRALATLTTGSEPSGYQVIKPEDSDLAVWMKRADIIAETVVPFTIADPLKALEHKGFPEIFPEPSTSGQLFGFPTKAGMSYTRAIKAYTSARDSGDSVAATYILHLATLEHMKPSSIIAGYTKNKSALKRNAAGPTKRFDVFGEEQK